MAIVCAMCAIPSAFAHILGWGSVDTARGRCKVRKIAGKSTRLVPSSAPCVPFHPGCIWPGTPGDIPTYKCTNMHVSLLHLPTRNVCTPVGHRLQSASGVASGVASGAASEAASGAASPFLATAVYVASNLFFSVQSALSAFVAPFVVGGFPAAPTLLQRIRSQRISMAAADMFHFDVDSLF